MSTKQDSDQSLDLQSENLFDRFIIHIGTLFFTLNITIVLAVVISRQIPDFDLNILQPLSIYILIVGVYFGAAISARNDSHISINFAVDEVAERSPVLGNGLRVVASFLSVIISAIFSYSTFIAANNNMGTNFPAVQIITPRDVYLIITFALLVMTIYEMINTYKYVSSLWISMRKYICKRKNETENGRGDQ